MEDSGGAAPVARRQERLALHGGEQVRREPFPPRGNLGQDERAAILAVVERGLAAGAMPGYNGDEEEAFCREFAAAMGAGIAAGWADAVSSGTAALYVALKALDLEPFGEVVVSAVTDPGGMMPIPLLNLIPAVADCAPGSYNSGPEQVAELLSPLTRAVVIAHIGGEPAGIEEIVALAHRRGIPVIEDCAQAHGARLDGRPVGSFGDIAVFSTMFGKHLSTGGQGGVVFTRNEGLYQAVRRASDRGKPFYLPDGSTNVTASLNLNLNDLAAAIGRVQLRKLPEVVARRQTIAGQLREGLLDLATVSLPAPIRGAQPSYWFLRLRFHAERMTCDRDTFCRALLAEGLPITPHYRAALPHTQEWFVRRRVFGDSGYPWASPDYQGDRDRHYPCPNAHAAMETHFNLQLHENWGTREVDDALAILRKVDAAYRRA
jgi:perosamine synthetase